MIRSPQLKRLLNQSIAINSTAFEDIDPETEGLAFVGSETETALQFAKDLGWENWKETCDSARTIQMIPFSSNKAMGVVVHLLSRRRVAAMFPKTRANASIPTRRLRPTRGNPLVAITGIEDPLRPTIRQAVAECHKASITIKVYTRDNILTARLIATQCSIYTAGGIIMEGPFFQALDHTSASKSSPPAGPGPVSRWVLFHRNTEELRVPHISAWLQWIYPPTDRSFIESLSLTSALPSRFPAYNIAFPGGTYM